MDNMQSQEGTTSHFESQQNREMTDCIASTSTENCDAVNENKVCISEEEEEKQRAKKTRRGKKKSKTRDSENGETNEMGNLSGEGASVDSHLDNSLANLSLSHQVPDKELEQFSNGVSTNVSNVKRTVRGTEHTQIVNDLSQEGAESSVTPQKEKDGKKKKKSKKKASTSTQISNTHQSPDHLNHMHRTPNSQNATPRKEPNASDKKKPRQYSRSSNATRENTTFDKYLLTSEVMAGLAANVLIKGAIRINQRNYKEAYINSPDKNQDIMIEGMRNRNRALEGDEVAIRLNSESEWKAQGAKLQKTGVVVYIFERIHPRVGVGFLKPMPDKSKDFALFSPRDSRIPRIRVPIEKCPTNFLKEAEKYETTMFLACIQDWQDVRYSIGDIVEEVGVSGDLKSETMAILLENDIEFSPYDSKLYQYFPRSPFEITEEEIKSRADLRNDCIFTIDPLTARDLDDAMSCKELDNGNFLIGVHISDVSYFLKEGTPLDLEVAKKATSTYLVQSVYHMLPQEMCMMCSLLPGEDKLAFSVFWEITQEAEIVSQCFTRSVIKSCAQLAYEHAQIMLENPDKEWRKDELPQIYGKYTPKDLSHVVNHLNRLAIIMREKRFKDGALRIDQPKLTFSLEIETGIPSQYSIYVNKECHRLIEEFMLLANVTVAKCLNTDFPDLAFLRSHPPPHKFIMEELQKSMERRGIFLDVTSAGSLQASMWRYAGDDHVSKARMMVLNNLCAKPMARAKYFCAKFQDLEEDFCHYALNMPLYTHFTSPIRRYADVMVHRLLSASLGYSPKPDWTPDHVQTIASICNKQKYQAKRAGEQSNELYLAVYIGRNIPMVEEAVVMDVKDLSFDIIVCNTGQVQRIYTNNLPSPAKVNCRMEGKKVIAQEIQWLPTDVIPYGTLQVVEIFSIVTVELSRSPVSLKVETRLLRPPGSGAFFA